MRKLEVLPILFFLTKFNYIKTNTMKKLLLILLFVPLVSFGQSQKKIKKIADKTIKIYLEKEIINESRNNCSSCSLSFVKNRDDELDFHSKFSFALRNTGLLDLLFQVENYILVVY
tara:strand:+ start:185 stop:532 length:348 start_codon:yes stop_codon:yes gene_type:complete